MEWLLTLFAMLGAVTGAHNGMRGEPTQVHQAEAAAGVQVVAAVAKTTVVRETPAVPALEASPGDAQSPPALRIVATAPIYADRLIE